VIGSIRRECLDHVLVFPGNLITTNPEFVLRLLSPIANASFVGEGLTGATSDSAAANGVCRGGAAGRWTAPPLRTTGCLKSPTPPRHGLSLLGPWAFVFELCALQTRASASLLHQTQAGSQTA
jgi:hypothetical protein